LLTSRTFTDRYLGANKQATGINDRLWMATGNNAQFGGDLGRRMAVVSLDPPTAGHHLRTDFKISGPVAWMESNRGEYLAALLITLGVGSTPTGPPRRSAPTTTRRGLVDCVASWSGQGSRGGSAGQMLT
jgi:hypothetical protein